MKSKKHELMRKAGGKTAPYSPGWRYCLSVTVATWHLERWQGLLPPPVPGPAARAPGADVLPSGSASTRWVPRAWKERSGSPAARSHRSSRLRSLPRGKRVWEGKSGLWLCAGRVERLGRCRDSFVFRWELGGSGNVLPRD